MKIKGVHLIYAGIIFLFCSFVAADNLAYHLQSGEIYSLEVSSSQVIRQTMMGKEQVTTSDMKSNLILRVMNASNAEVILDAKYDSIWLRMLVPGGKIEGSTRLENGKPGIFSRVFREICKSHLQVHMNNIGEIASATGLDTSFYAIIEEYKDMPEQIKTLLKESLTQKFNSECFRLELQQITAIYPKKSIKTGGHWKNKIPLGNGLPGNIENTWILNNMSEGIFNLTLEGRISPPEDNDFIPYNGILMKYDLNGSQKGQCSIDQLTGWIREGNSLQEINGSVRLLGTPQMPEGISWPISIKSSIKYTGLKLK